MLALSIYFLILFGCFFDIIVLFYVKLAYQIDRVEYVYNLFYAYLLTIINFYQYHILIICYIYYTMRY